MEDKKFRIVMTTDTVGGVWNYSLELCRALMPHHVEVHLISLGKDPSAGQIKEVNRLKNTTLYPYPFKLEWMENSTEDVKNTARKVQQFCQIIQPDLVHLNNYVDVGKIMNIPKLTVFHSCVQTWWMAVKGHRVPENWRSYLKLVQNSLNTSDMAVFPTEAIRQAACSAHRIRTRSAVIHNGRYTPGAGTTPKSKFILCTGRIWDEGKNLELLGRVAGRLPWPVYVAGQDTPPNGSEAVSFENLRFLGKLNSRELDYWLEGASIYVNPALYEPFGLAVLEAARAGCALVISDLKTLKEVWQEDARYFDPRDDEELTETLLHLIEENATRKKYQKKARQRALQFSVSDLGNSYFRLYKELTETKISPFTSQLSAV